ncbi:MAG: hypothetical protein ACPW61_12215 [Methyloligella sp. ZOD6]
MHRTIHAGAEKANPSFLLTWRFRHAHPGRGPLMPGPRCEPAREPAFRHWRWDREAAQKAKAPIRDVIAHPSRLA